MTLSALKYSKNYKYTIYNKGHNRCSFGVIGVIGGFFRGGGEHFKAKSFFKCGQNLRRGSAAALGGGGWGGITLSRNAEKQSSFSVA